MQCPWDGRFEGMSGIGRDEVAQDPIERNFWIREIGPRQKTARGNTFIECRDQTGDTVAFWGGKTGFRNIEKIEACRHSLPLLVVCDCIDPTSPDFGHAWWVPENARVEPVAGGQPKK
jgi:hypothetical protein